MIQRQSFHFETRAQIPIVADALDTQSSTRYRGRTQRALQQQIEGPTNRLPVGSYSNRILLVCGVPASRGSGVVWRVSLEYSLWVGFMVLRLVCEVLVSVSCVSRLPRCL